MTYDKILETVIETVANQIELDPDEINADTSLTEDLKIDSLDFVEICIALEDIYGISFDTDQLSKSTGSSTTINNLCDYILSLINE